MKKILGIALIASFAFCDNSFSNKSEFSANPSAFLYSNEYQLADMRIGSYYFDDINFFNVIRCKINGKMSIPQELLALLYDEICAYKSAKERGETYNWKLLLYSSKGDSMYADSYKVVEDDDLMLLK